MARREEAAGLLRQGNPPSRIAEIMGLSRQTVMGYLNQKIGERELSRYELIVSMNREDRDTIDRLWERFAVEKAYKSLTEFIVGLLKNCKSLDAGDALEYLLLRDAAFADMYEFIRAIETNLHARVKLALVREYGAEDWWRSGVPLKVRKELQCLREEDADPGAEPFNYTTIIHLKEICDAEWTVLRQALRPEAGADKKGFLSSLTRLNRIRNSVMHPVRKIPLKDEDFAFARSLRDLLGIGRELGTGKEAPSPGASAGPPLQC